MQQISAKDSVPFNEEYTLGEQHDMGEIKAAYYISYTKKDIRRYTANIIYRIIGLINVICACIIIYFSVRVLFGMHYNIFYFFPLILLLPLDIFLSSYRLSQYKWDNFPLIFPRTRHLRVYVYQEGLIKQTDERSEVIRWSEIAKITYIPKSKTERIQAGITLQLRNKRTLRISGAIVHIDELAELLKYMRNKKVL